MDVDVDVHGIVDMDVDVHGTVAPWHRGCGCGYGCAWHRGTVDVDVHGTVDVDVHGTVDMDVDVDVHGGTVPRCSLWKNMSV